MVMLSSGWSVPLEALELLWSIEDRGLTVRVTEAGNLLVGPRRALSDTDRAIIRTYKHNLVQLVRHCEQLQVM